MNQVLTPRNNFMRESLMIYQFHEYRENRCFKTIPHPNPAKAAKGEIILVNKICKYGYQFAQIE